MPSLRLGIDARGARSGAREFNRATGTVTKSAQKAGAAVKGFAVSLVGVFAVRQVARVIGQFEESVVTLGAVAGATASELERLEKTARGLGATTRFSAVQTADGLTFLARAGFDASEAIAAIPATLNLAQVGLLDLGKAADIASNVVSQFGLEADDTVRVVDALVIVSNRANTNVLQLSEALKFAGPIAGALGNSVEQTAAALGVLGDRGIQGTLAGTGLRTSLLKLADPTERARGAIESLGLSVRSLNPEVNDIVTIFGRLGEAQASASTLGAIFGSRTAATAIILSQSADRVRELEQATKDYAGEAEKIARLQDDTLPGSFKELSSAATELTLAMGDSGVGGAFRTASDLATDVLRALAGIEVEGEELSATAETLAFTLKAASVALAGLAAVKISTFLAGYIADIGRAIVLNRAFANSIDQTSRIAGLQRAIQGLTSPLGLVLTATALAAATFIDLGDEADKLERRLARSGSGVTDLSSAIEKLNENRSRIKQASDLGDFATVARLAANEITLLNEGAVGLQKSLAELGSGSTTNIGEALALGLDQGDIDSLVGAARLGLRNAFADAAEDNFISSSEIQGIRNTFGTLFDDQDGLFGDSVDEFLSSLRSGASQVSGQGVGSALAADIDADSLLLQFDKRFDQTRVRTAAILEIINERIKSVGEVATDAGGEAGEALGDDLQDKLERLREAVAGVDLEGALLDPSRSLRDAVDEFGAALDASNVKLTETSSAVTTLERALEQLEKAEGKLADRQASGVASLDALRQGLVEERQEVGLSTTELNQLRLERQLNSIAQKGEIEISDQARQELSDLRTATDAAKVAQEGYDQAARSTAQGIASIVTGSQSAEDAALRLAAAIQQQLLDQAFTQPLTDAISGGIQSASEGIGSFFGGGNGGVGDAVGDLAADSAEVTAISASSALRATETAAQTSALTIALSAQTAAITTAIASSAASSGGGEALGGLGGALGPAGAGASGPAPIPLPSASGNAFGAGGVVNVPSLASLASGALGSMAERDSEAIMPLARGAGGRLGVEVAGGSRAPSVTNVTINTPNADSFRRSGRQEANQARRTARL